ncbi:hypothetical protein [Curvibacter lanceolatus]|uniref:hypothetical protein n=1 Tax=Curvibacter lanceolatus TaxID=86182 RepID=UPI00035C7296|nr:hypothetical protein [Curvibacter lanceolatus]
MFTAQNTNGFNAAELALMNEAVSALMAQGWDEKDASDLVNNNFQDGADNTVETLTRH